MLESKQESVDVRGVAEQMINALLAEAELLKGKAEGMRLLYMELLKESERVNGSSKSESP